MRFVDKLIKIFIISGSEQWIRFHIEVQRYNNRHFAERMFIYTGFSINTKSQLLQLRFSWIITHDLNQINLNRIFLALKIAP